MLSPEIKIPPITSPAPELPYATPSQFIPPPDWTNAETFTLDPNKRSAFLILVVSLSVLITCILLAAVLATMFLMSGSLDRTEVILLIVIMCSFQLIATARLFFRHRRSWPTRVLLIADQGFINSSLSSPRVRVDAPEIARITETWDAFKVILRSARHVFISKRIPDSDLPKLRARLTHFQPLSPGHGLTGTLANILLTWGLSLASVICFYIGILSPHPRLVLTLALATLLITAIRITRVFLNKSSTLTLRILIFIDLLFPIILTLRYLALRYM